MQDNNDDLNIANTMKPLETFADNNQEGGEINKVTKQDVGSQRFENMQIADSDKYLQFQGGDQKYEK